MHSPGALWIACGYIYMYIYNMHTVVSYTAHFSELMTTNTGYVSLLDSFLEDL